MDDLRKAINQPSAKLTSLSGGDFAQSFRCDTDKGERYLVKTHAHPPSNFFTIEATSLTWLRNCKSLNVPKVLSVSDDASAHLMLEWINPSSQNNDDSEFGAALAALHKQPFDCFGRSDEHTTGSQAMPNPITLHWHELFAEQRLHYLCTIAEKQNALPTRTFNDIHKLSEKLDQIIPSKTLASLVHGDLWAGNRISDEDGKSWLIDPAAHGNFREFDLALMKLFCGFSNNCFDAHNEAYPLEPNWEDRIPLMQLPTLIVHAIEFGGHYVSATAQAVKHSLGL